VNRPFKYMTESMRQHYQLTLRLHITLFLE